MVWQVQHQRWSQLLLWSFSSINLVDFCQIQICIAGITSLLRNAQINRRLKYMYVLYMNDDFECIVELILFRFGLSFYQFSRTFENVGAGFKMKLVPQINDFRACNMAPAETDITQVNDIRAGYTKLHVFLIRLKTKVQKQFRKTRTSSNPNSLQQQRLVEWHALAKFHVWAG